MQDWESSSAGIDAEFAATSPEIQNAIRDYKQFWTSLSDTERAKLEKVHKLLKHYAKRGVPMRSERDADALIESAVQHADVEKELFDRWWNVLAPVLKNGVNFSLQLRWSGRNLRPD